jgi:signal peptidase complex subunit 3
MHSWTQRLLAAATTAAFLLAATCAAASALDAFHVPSVEAQAHVWTSSSPRFFRAVCS